jgi:hypothetical protein
MAITYVSAASAAATSLTLPTHAKNDLLVMFAYNTSGSTIPTLPSGWISRYSVSASSRNALVAVKTATSNSETSGTWTNATFLGCAVYRSDASLMLWAGGLASVSASNSATMTYNTISGANFFRTDGTANSWVVGFAGSTTDDVADTPPTGMTNRTSVVSTGEIAIHDTNGAVSSWSSQSVATTSVTYRSITLEIFETDIAIATGGGVPLIGHGGLVY